jgi:hypothetical protein
MAVLFDIVNAASQVVRDATHRALLLCNADPTQTAAKVLQIPHNTARLSSNLCMALRKRCDAARRGG